MTDIIASKVIVLIERLETTTITPKLPNNLTKIRATSIDQHEFQSYISRIKDDLFSHIEIVSRFLNHYDRTGEYPPPHYANRIAIILSKSKQKPLELRFLKAWNRLFKDGNGVTYKKLVIREKKLSFKLSNSTNHPS